MNRIFLLASLICILLFNSCSYDDDNSYILESNSAFTISDIKELLIKKNITISPLWNDALTYGTGKDITYEIPISNIHDINFIKSSSASFDRILAYKNEFNQIEIKYIHYFILNSNASLLENDQIFIQDLKKYDGFYTISDLQKNSELVTRFKEGKVLKSVFNRKNGTPDLKNMPADCSVYTETVITRHVTFWIYNDGSTEIISEWYSSEVYSYESCNYEGGGGGGGTTVVEKEEEITTDVITEDLDEKSLCVFLNLQNTSSGFSSLLKDFDTSFEVEYLIYETQDLNSSRNAKTLPPENYSITIQINNNRLNRPNLSLARTLIHETLHAQMFRELMDILQNGGDLDGLTVREWKEKLSTGDPDIYNYYAKYGNDGLNDMQHEQIADNYISTISSFLEEFQPGFAESIYESLAWEGLMGTDAWNKLDGDIQDQIKDEINMVDNLGAENCSYE